MAKVKSIGKGVTGAILASIVAVFVGGTTGCGKAGAKAVRTWMKGTTKHVRPKLSQGAKYGIYKFTKETIKGKNRTISSDRDDNYDELLRRYQTGNDTGSLPSTGTDNFPALSLESRARMGDADAQYELGCRYERMYKIMSRHGDSGPIKLFTGEKEKEKAIYWYKKAAAQGHIRAAACLLLL